MNETVLYQRVTSYTMLFKYGEQLRKSGAPSLLSSGTATNMFELYGMMSAFQLRKSLGEATG
jgi:hypothetical protein